MRALPLLLLGLMGCQPEMSDMMGGDPMDAGEWDMPGEMSDGGMPLDAEADLAEPLRINHVQMRGTVNSYHTVLHDFEPELMGYIHLPLGEQASQQGIRFFDFDLIPDRRAGIDLDPAVTDHPSDDETQCISWRWCLRELADWMDAHPGHPLIVVMVGEAFLFATTHGLHYQLDDLEAAINASFALDRILTPAEVRGGYDSLREAITDSGWPTVEATRGKAMFILNDRALARAAYILYGGLNRERPLLFRIGDPDHADDPHAGDEVVFTFEPELIDDPWYFDTDPADLDRIEALAAAGFLVHAISDAPEMIGRLRAAGAHFIGTRFPDAAFGAIPETGPTVCNPVTMPDGCGPGVIQRAN